MKAPTKAPAKPVNMAEMRAKMRSAMAAAKRGPPKPVDVKGDPIAGFKPDTDNPLDTMNNLVGAIDGAIQKHRSKLTAAAASEAKSTQHTLGTGYYFTVVFDTEAQRDAFIGKLKMKCNLSETGGLFIDGREVAAALGIEIPAADHALSKKEFRAVGMTAKHKTLASAKHDPEPEAPPPTKARAPRKSAKKAEAS